MVKALLLSMPEVFPVDWDEQHITPPSMGLASLAANVSSEHKVYVGDLVTQRADVKAGVDYALRFSQPEAVGLNAMTCHIHTALRIAGYIKNQSPDTRIVIGGYHVTGMRADVEESYRACAKYRDLPSHKTWDSLDEALSEPGWENIDGVFYGEADHTFSRFLDLIEQGKVSELDTITGLSFRRNGNWVHTPRHDGISTGDMNSVKVPNLDNLIWKDYHFHSRPFYVAEGSKGCTHYCSFCCLPAMNLAGSFRAFPVERTVQYLKYLRSNGIKSVFFADDNPLLDLNWFNSLLDGIMKEGLNEDMYFSGFLTTSVMAKHRNLAKKMRTAGWDFGFLPVETIDKTILKDYRKGTSADLAARAIDNMRSAGITTLAGLVKGNPHETEASIVADFDFLKQHPPDAVIPQKIMPHLGTPSRVEAIHQGLLINNGRYNSSDNPYLGWHTYNGAFAHCKTLPDSDGRVLMPEDIEFIVWREKRDFEKSNFNPLVFFRKPYLRNNPGHLWKWAKEDIPMLIRESIETRGMTEKEIFLRKKKELLAVNTFNI